MKVLWKILTHVFRTTRIVTKIVYSQNSLIRQGLSHDSISDKRECRNIESVTYTRSQSHTFLDNKDMPLYVTKIIRNIHCIHNDTNNLVVYLFLFNNYDTINDQNKIQHKGLFSRINQMFNVTYCVE